MALQIQGQNQTFETINRDGANYVSLRDVVDSLGGTLDWDNINKIAQATIGSTTATIPLANAQIDVNGQSVTLDNLPLVDDSNQMIVPVTFFRSAFGYDVTGHGSEVQMSLPAA